MVSEIKYIHEWTKAILIRDNYTCQECGGKENLEAHHKKSKINFPELILDLKNGITLCKDCHRGPGKHFVSRSPKRKETSHEENMKSLEKCKIIIDRIKLKKIMTDFAAGHITEKQKDDELKGIKVAEDKTEDEIEGKEEIAPINSKNGKKQRNKAREKLSDEAEEEKTQTRKLNEKKEEKQSHNNI